MKLFVATRKGLFTATRGSRGWDLHEPAFLGAPVTAVVNQGEDTWCAVGHGHFGAKMHRSRDGKTFAEVGTPKYPPRPEGAPDEKDAFGGKDPTWIGIGFAISDAGLLLLLLSLGLAYWWKRGGKPIAGRVVACLTTVYLVLLGVAWFAMSAKWG